MADLRKFVPLAKMEEQADGSLHVYGIVTAEAPDLDNEVCDYEGTKPYYKARAEAMLKATSSTGATPSVMPLREMHQLNAIGAGRSMEFDDAQKCIRMGFDVVDPAAVTKFKKGVLIGFSQGGSYVGEKVPDPIHKGCSRYIADPGEVSAVDSPCLPSALVESMKGRTVTLTKATGVTEEIPLALEPKNNALDIANELDKLSASFEAFKAEFAEKSAQIQSHATISAERGAFSMKITTPEELSKAAKSIHDHLAGLKEKHDAMGEHMKKAHESMEAKHEAMGEHIEKCMKAAKDAMDGEEPEKAVTPPVQKGETPDFAKMVSEAVTAATKPLTDKVADLEKKLKETPAPPAAHTGAVGFIAKADANTLFAELLPTSSVAH